VQVGNCINVPASGEVETLKSFKIINCDESLTSSHLALSILFYTQSECMGVGIPFTSSTELPSVCDDSLILPTKFSCQNNPQSLAELWPAVSVHFDDNMCTSAALYFAVHPGCIYLGGVGFGMECMNDDTVLAFQMFKDAEACTNNIVDNYLAVPTELCLPVKISLATTTTSNIKIASQLLEHTAAQVLGRQLRRGLELDQAVTAYSGYYVAHCNGY
jgi:hypothetical protein